MKCKKHQELKAKSVARPRKVEFLYGKYKSLIQKFRIKIRSSTVSGSSYRRNKVMSVLSDRQRLSPNGFLWSVIYYQRNTLATVYTVIRILRNI